MQQKKIIHQNISVTLKKVRRAKVIRILVKAGNEVVVTGPTWISWKQMECFVEEKREWVEKQRQFFVERPEILLQLSPEEYQAKKKKAEEVVREKLRQWQKIYGYTWRSVSIRNQKTRWGSCSAQKNLSFHVRIVDLPERLQDYLIVHELCHLEEMNHSPRFWSLVERGLPESQHLKKELQSFIMKE